MLSHAYDYRSVLETSQKVNWKLEEVIGGRTLDFSRPFLPESLAGLGAIRCLNPEEKRTLNRDPGVHLPVPLRPGGGVHRAVAGRPRAPWRPWKR